MIMFDDVWWFLMDPSSLWEVSKGGAVNGPLQRWAWRYRPTSTYIYYITIASIHVYIHLPIYNKYIYKYTYIYINIHTYIHYIHTYIYIYIYIHTYIYTYIHTYILNIWVYIYIMYPYHMCMYERDRELYRHDMYSLDTKWHPFSALALNVPAERSSSPVKSPVEHSHKIAMNLSLKWFILDSLYCWIPKYQ